ncbi:hypothetical protein BC830DRAFT_1163903 [Chytriomyces sp. MP71]|nr:hypothetical protein BC830DRAFT_1163903 [Chytriomyces sp. MP71]
MTSARQPLMSLSQSIPIASIVPHDESNRPRNQLLDPVSTWPLKHPLPPNPFLPTSPQNFLLVERQSLGHPPCPIETTSSTRTSPTAQYSTPPRRRHSNTPAFGVSGGTTTPHTSPRRSAFGTAGPIHTRRRRASSTGGVGSGMANRHLNSPGFRTWLESVSKPRVTPSPSTSLSVAEPPLDLGHDTLRVLMAEMGMGGCFPDPVTREDLRDAVHHGSAGILLTGDYEGYDGYNISESGMVSEPEDGEEEVSGEEDDDAFEIELEVDEAFRSLGF